jgi:multimeric flavodoxin WrbA
MKAIAFNGSPRKEWNTATLLKSALEGAAAQGAETELVNLYDLDYKGCASCFACKLKGGKSVGRCAVRDGLSPYLDKIESYDLLLLGSPIYIGGSTGEFRSFTERLLFPFLEYSEPLKSLSPRKIKTAFIYTLGATPDREALMLAGEGFAHAIAGVIFGATPEVLAASDTLQFSDYGKYYSSRFDPLAKAERHATDFQDKKKLAFELGARLAVEA